MKPISINRSKNWVTCLAGALLIIVFLFHKPNYLNTGELYFWIGMLALPFTFKIRRNIKSTRFFGPAAASGLVSIFFPTTFLIYCSMVFGILFIIEQLEGKVNLLFAFHLLLLSPLFQYFESLISFPIRLGLSTVAANLLLFAGYDVELSGNLIKLDGVDFLVDSACSGLYMLRYSFLFAVIILALLQTESRRWHFAELGLLFTALFALNILGNLIRIILLIVFKVMPDFWFHEVLGLLIFLMYTLLPFYLLSSYRARRKRMHPVKNSGIKSMSLRQFTTAYAFVMGVFLVACWQNSNRTEARFQLNDSITAAYAVQKVNDRVFKLRTENALVYLKPPVAPYHADHNPLICWKGSGYDFKHISSGKIGSLQVSIAELVKGDDKLFTMWWFDSGKHQTSSQWDWRWRSFSTNEEFYLVNVTAASMDKLHHEAKILLNQKIIQ